MSSNLKAEKNDVQKFEDAKKMLGTEYFEKLKARYSPLSDNPEWETDCDYAINIAISSAKSDLSVDALKKAVESHLETFASRLPWIDIMNKYHSGDKELEALARNQACDMLNKYLWDLIWKNYSSFVGNHREELFNEGIIGILEGLKNFQPHRSVAGVHFWTYIKHQLAEYINTTVNHSNAYFQKNIRIIKDKITEFEAKGIPWSAKEISVATGINAETVNNCLAIINGTEGTVDISSEEYTTALGSANFSKSAEDVYIDSSESKALYEALDNLPERDANIVKIYYGLMPDKEIRQLIKINKEKVTKKAIGDAYGISESDVARIINTAKRRLKAKLNPNARKKKCINETEFAFTKRKSNFRDLDFM